MVGCGRSVPSPVRWVFQVLDRIVAGDSVTADEVARHYAPAFLEDVPVEKIVADFRDVAPIASQIVSLDPEFVVPRGTMLGVVSSQRDGCRYRWEFDIDDDRIERQILAKGPLPDYRDRVIDASDAQILARDYAVTGGGAEHILLLHSFGAEVGCWDMVVPHLKGAATVRGIDLRGHGRSDARHGYSLCGCLDDIAAATSDIDNSELTLVGHSLGGYVAVEYAARTSCRAVIALDGPATRRRNDTPEDIAATPEPLRSVLAEHADTDYGEMIAGSDTPTLLVLARGSADRPEPDEAIQQRQQLARYVIEHGHSVRWVDTDHGILTEETGPAAPLINQFLSTHKPLAP